MLLAEALGDESSGDRVKIYATDVDEDALADAHGTRRYTPSEIESVPPERCANATSSASTARYASARSCAAR